MRVQRYIFQPGYSSLSAEERQALLEQGRCPTTVRLQGCDDLHMNFAIDWNLLRPALQLAFDDMQAKHVRVLDGVGTA